jgi:hypothetical protein
MIRLSLLVSLHEIIEFGLLIQDALQLILAVKLHQNISRVNSGAVAHDPGDDQGAAHLAGKTRSLNGIGLNSAHRTVQSQDLAEVVALDDNGIAFTHPIRPGRRLCPMMPRCGTT